MLTDYNGQNPNLLSSNGFKNNNFFSSQEIIFFYESTKFLWKELMKINSTYILKSKDISQLEPYVENILYSKLLPDDIELLSNEYIVQLVTLLQLTGQYLVYTQKRLEFENQDLKERINELEYNYKETEKLQSLIDSLNRQNQEKDFLIKTYQNMINSGYGQGQNVGGDNKNIIDSDNNILRNKKSGVNESEKKLYFCKYCTGKKFKSQKYLDEHIQRRHFDQIDIDSEKDYQEARENFKEKQYKEIFEKKLNSLRDYCEKLFQQNNENTELNLINRKIDYLNDQLMSQNNLKINYNYNQNGICNNCRQNLSGMPQRNINLERNEQRYTSNKEIELLNEQLNNLKNDYTNLKSQIHNQINTGKKDIHKNKIENGKKSGEIMNNNININTRQNIRNRTSYSNNVNPKEKEVDINIEKYNINIENKNIKNTTETFKNDFISNEPKNPDKENNINDNNINININTNTNGQKKPELELNLNSSDNKKDFTNTGDNEEDNKFKDSNPKDENNKNYQINLNNNININNNENNDDGIENKNVNVPITINNVENENSPTPNEDNILKDKKIIDVDKDKKNDKNGEDNIYEKEENLSANFGNKDKDKEKDNGIAELNEDKSPESAIASFKKKMIKRDEDFYNEKENEYEVIEIPSQFNVEMKEINNKVDNVLNKKELGDLIDDYKNKKKNNENLKGKDIYKVLGLDDILKKYEDYMADKQKEKEKEKETEKIKSDISKSKSKNSKIEAEIKIENIDINSNNKGKFLLQSSNNPSVNNNNLQNPYSRNDTINKSKIQIDNNKNIGESSIGLLEQNLDSKNPKKLEQSIVIGHDLTKSVA